MERKPVNQAARFPGSSVEASFVSTRFCFTLSSPWPAKRLPSRRLLHARLFSGSQPRGRAALGGLVKPGHGDQKGLAQDEEENEMTKLRRLSKPDGEKSIGKTSK